MEKTMLSISVLLDFYNTFVNTVVRQVPDFWKAVICLASFTIGMYCFAKAIVLKDKKLFPFKTGMFLVFLLCIAICVFYLYYW